MPILLFIVSLSALFGVALANAQAPVSEPNPVFQLQKEFTPQEYVERGSSPKQPRQAEEEDDPLALLAQIQRLQQEVRELRGQLEINSHEIQLLKEQLNQKQSAGDNLGEQQAGSTRKKTDIYVQPKIKSGQNDLLDKLAADLPEQQGTTVVPDDPEEVYQSAYQTLQRGNYEQAKQELADFAKAHPKHKRAADAHYWLGDLYLLDQDYEQALNQFAEVEQRYPDYPRLPEVLLKLGIAYQELGEEDIARQYFVEVQQRSPNSTAARLAAQRLQTGH